MFSTAIDPLSFLARELGLINRRFPQQLEDSGLEMAWIAPCLALPISFFFRRRRSSRDLRVSLVRLCNTLAAKIFF